MTFDPQTWFKFAKFIAPETRRDWLRAMEAELSEIRDSKEQSRFAMGCFKSLAAEAVRSRKGLNYIARLSGAALIVIMCTLGIWNSAQWGNSPSTFTASTLLISLCAYYLISAALLLGSLRWLKVYAAIGMFAAISAWLHITLTSLSFETLSTLFLQLICVEMTGLMMGLYFASIYLTWLYNPKTQL